ncbi:Diguanylate cyclase/phosphodiesterase with PAS/PAC sensor(S), partial [Pararhodospirillum photometricum DSM 122]
WPRDDRGCVGRGSGVVRSRPRPGPGPIRGGPGPRGSRPARRGIARGDGPPGLGPARVGARVCDRDRRGTRRLTPCHVARCVGGCAGRWPQGPGGGAGCGSGARLRAIGPGSRVLSAPGPTHRLAPGLAGRGTGERCHRRRGVGRAGRVGLRLAAGRRPPP